MRQPTDATHQRTRRAVLAGLTSTTVVALTGCSALTGSGTCPADSLHTTASGADPATLPDLIVENVLAGRSCTVVLRVRAPDGETRYSGSPTLEACTSQSFSVWNDSGEYSITTGTREGTKDEWTLSVDAPADTVIVTAVDDQTVELTHLQA